MEKWCIINISHLSTTMSTFKPQTRCLLSESSSSRETWSLHSRNTQITSTKKCSRISRRVKFSFHRITSPGRTGWPIVRMVLNTTFYKLCTTISRTPIPCSDAPNNIAESDLLPFAGLIAGLLKKTWSVLKHVSKKSALLMEALKSILTKMVSEV